MKRAADRRTSLPSINTAIVPIEEVPSGAGTVPVASGPTESLEFRNQALDADECKELAASLSDCNRTVTALDLGDARVASLTPLLAAIEQRGTVRSLNLGGMGIVREGRATALWPHHWNVLGRLLAKGQLTQLDLSQHPFSSPGEPVRAKDLRPLLDGLSQSQSLVHLSLANSALTGEGLKLVGAALQRQQQQLAESSLFPRYANGLHSLDLSGNGAIDYKAADEFISGLSSNKSLTTLDMKGVCVKDGCHLWTPAYFMLESNSTLLYLKLPSNPMGDPMCVAAIGLMIENRKMAAAVAGRQRSRDPRREMHLCLRSRQVPEVFCREIGDVMSNIAMRVHGVV